MPDLLIELFSEEIPARMQARAADDLKKRMTDGLVEAGLTYAGAAAYVTPRRLTLTVSGLTAESPTIREERKGPKVGAPDKAIEGFLRGAGVSRDELEERDTPKGAVYFATIEKPGRKADAIVAEVFHGEFDRAHSPVSQFTLGYDPSVEGLYPHDPAKAATLLDQAGWTLGADGLRQKDGVPLKVGFHALPVNSYPEFGAIVSRQLAALGIGVTVELLSPPDWIRAGMAGDHNLIPQGKYASSSQFLAFVYHSRQSGPGAYGWSKRGPDEFAQIDTLIDAAETQLDPVDYVPLFNAVQREVMEAALALPLHCNTNLIAARREVTGLKFDAIGAYPLFHDTQLTEGA